MEIQWGFNFLSQLIQLEFWLFMLGLISSISFFIFKNKINFKSLLTTKTNNPYSPERLQLLLITLIFAAYYLLNVLHSVNICKLKHVPCTMPPIPSEFLFALGGSNFVYLWGKLSTILKQRRSERV
ncbi:hypothetical protein NIES22_09030 [Calothrix brevissima NIES-22]|nr:hypothetical protein NIES22_09030 [Calothrix brevissima NIES-22]